MAQIPDSSITAFLKEKYPGQDVKVYEGNDFDPLGFWIWDFEKEVHVQKTKADFQAIWQKKKDVDAFIKTLTMVITTRSELAAYAA